MGTEVGGSKRDERRAWTWDFLPVPDALRPLLGPYVALLDRHLTALGQ